MFEQYNFGLGLVREDMGLEYRDKLLIDSQYTDDELVLLNMEVTPEIEHILNAALFAQAMKDLTDWQKIRDEYDILHPDYERVLNNIIDFNEEQMKNINKVVNEAKELDIQRKQALSDLNNWMERYNVWQNSDVYKNYPHKSAAAKIFFNGLKARKEAYHSLKNQVADKWNQVKRLWAELPEKMEAYIGPNKFLWKRYYDLLGEDINEYFTTGEVEDVDDYSLLANTQYEIVDMLQLTHYNEEFEYTRPEKENSVGFWDFRYEAGIKFKHHQYELNEYYWKNILQEQ